MSGVGDPSRPHHPRPPVQSAAARLLGALLLVAGGWGCASSTAAPAANPPAAAEATASGPSSAGGAVPHSPSQRPSHPTAGPATEAASPGPGGSCETFSQDRSAWLDRLHTWVGRTVCRTINGFDGFFGNQRSEDERNRTGGLIGLNLRWSEHDGLEPQLRFRARFRLPNLSRRLKLFVGRQTEDEYLRDSRDRSFQDTMARNGDYDWVLGLGGATSSLKASRFRFNVGLKLNLPVQLYTKGQYRWLVRLGHRRLGRFRQTVFWRNLDGFGATTNLDLEQRFRKPFLLRWEGSGTISEISDGVEWFTGLTLYQRLTEDLAARYRTWVRGATGASVTTGEYGFEVFLRRRMFRPWLFGQVGSGVSWIRDHPWERRKASFSILVGAEMQFGHRTVY